MCMCVRERVCERVRKRQRERVCVCKRERVMCPLQPPSDAHHPGVGLCGVRCRV